jgi:bifunctional non-homologous end joining protein LigD
MTNGDFIICGCTRNAGAGLFSTLILGEYEGDKLHFVGEVGTGFNQKTMEAIMQKIKPLKKSPFPSESKLNNRWHKKKPEIIGWCIPKLVCTVKDGRIDSVCVMAS